MNLAQLLTQLILPIALALMMFSMGLALTFSDFRRVQAFPRPAILGILMQLLLLPVIAWAMILLLALWIEVPQVLAFGILILAACPGGATSNVISYLAGGDSALSISMTAVVSLLMPFILPISLAYQLSWLGGDPLGIQLPIVKTIMQLLLVTVAPVLLAMALRYYWPKTIIKVEPVFRRVMGFLFFLLVVLLLLVQWPQLKQLGDFILVLCIALSLSLCIVAMGISYWIAKQQGFDRRTGKTLAIEVGIQNAGTGIFIAAVLLQNSEMALIPLTYGLVMNIPALILIILNRRTSSTKQ